MNEIKTGARRNSKLTVLNPVGYPPEIKAKTPAPRLGTLDGKTVYLVDCRFDDSIELLKQVEAWFADNMAAVETRMISLSSTYQIDDPETWKEIGANGDAAILGVGH
ncbi:MAG: hypothetical protein QGH73_03350 [Rhodospirillales bacterium]|jgi:hypothetical protein|nr:hypothetical protein [Rhodospirillaceae bacterium]MDP6428281.1 hypothetical protein [Rhodospirillales bacterium]MDP6646146.1 hypothetical protein [Rhodospirillales bacterium]MDP6840695.1 hypothetical protein [Rhodospirillales bacterium]|tara:strand:- start:831 stop:1151 length:321 start_codon:yes stop_codon:yes gene_type:complete